MLLSMLYALLAMSVIISVFGIVNTLVLSVYERTRELGMLRAIGSSRRQLRRMVRYESVITSAIGGVLGIAVGVVFAYVVTTKVRAGRLRLLGAVPATRRLPHRRRDGRRGGGGAACAAGRAHRHPRGHPPRVTSTAHPGARRSSPSRTARARPSGRVGHEAGPAAQQPAPARRSEGARSTPRHPGSASASRPGPTLRKGLHPAAGDTGSIFPGRQASSSCTTSFPKPSSTGTATSSPR